MPRQCQMCHEVCYSDMVKDHYLQVLYTCIFIHFLITKHEQNEQHIQAVWHDGSLYLQHSRFCRSFLWNGKLYFVDRSVKFHLLLYICVCYIDTASIVVMIYGIKLSISSLQIWILEGTKIQTSTRKFPEKLDTYSPLDFYGAKTV